jgi:hypothetical protein
MSWSVAKVGKAAAVREKLAEDFNRIKCSEPEETIKNLVRDAIHTELGAYPPNFPVRVEACGSQSTPDYSKAPHEILNSMSVKLEPVHGFVE